MKAKFYSSKKRANGKFPGGTPENNETAEETLRRELIEEADVAISHPLPLGVQRVDYPNNPKTSEGDLYYQYRYICLIDELQESSPDPDTGITNPRMFVPAEEVTNYVNWGIVGKAMFDEAIKQYSQKLAKKS